MSQTTYGIREGILTALGAVLLGACQTAGAATLCVNPTGASGCQSTIGKAVSAASSGDTIQVAAGTYKEDVVIKMPLSLIGAGSANTIIDATGLANGIFVDGPDAMGIQNVVIAGFTVQNANFAGILVEKATAITIWNNQILKNNRGLNIAGSEPTCPGLPAALEPGEDQDCGEGLNLSGVDHSVVSNNVIQGNSGGILMSDDIGPTFDNIITANIVSGNSFACGITLASHSGMGVYQNTITGNQSMNNGFKVPGAGAGIGIFAPGPGSKAYGNVVLNNTLTSNGLPGVALHNHAAPPGAPPVNLNDNVIIGNTISGNGADQFDTATAGPTGINIFSQAPVTGTLVFENNISQEAIGMVFSAPSGQLVASLNNFLNPVAFQNLSTGTVDAVENWWGCPTGPNTAGCALARGSGITSAPVLTSLFNGTAVPAPPGSGTVTPTGTVTIVLTGPGGATSPTNSFQVFASQATADASHSTSGNPGPLTYSWTVSPGFPGGAGIAGANTATPTFQFSAAQTTYQYTLTVTDSAGVSATATITIQYI
jgi:hypothetical protein